jgi:hypothetical protein
MFVGLSASATRGCAIYADSSGSPHTLVCGGFVTSNPTANSWLAITMTGCPSTLTGSAGTQFWVSQLTTDAQSGKTVGTSGVNDACPGTAGIASFQTTSGSQSTSSWTTPFPASANIFNGCYSAYVQLSYSTVATYNIVSYNTAGCDISTGICVTQIAPVQSGHGMLVIASPSSATLAVSSVKTTLNGTTTDTLTKIGSCAGAGSPWCFFWIDRATAGVNGVTCTFTSIGADKVKCISIELQGTIASGSADQNNYDTSFIQAAPFTSANHVTTGQAELIIGFDFDTGVPNVQGTTDNIAAGSGWTFIHSGQTIGGAGAMVLTEFRISAAGTYNVSGTASCCAASNGHVPGMITLK